MARFNPSTYDPTADSSTLTKAELKEHDGKVVLKMQDGSCPCGCLENPRGKKTSFLQGHDAKLKGILIRAHLTNTPVVEVRDGEPFERLPIEVAKDREWQGFLYDAEEREALRNSSKTPKVGDTIKAKVGRWERTGKVTASDDSGYTIEYQTKSGETKTATVGVDDLL